MKVYIDGKLKKSLWVQEFTVGDITGQFSLTGKIPNRFLLAYSSIAGKQISVQKTRGTISCAIISNPHAGYSSIDIQGVIC